MFTRKYLIVISKKEANANYLEWILVVSEVRPEINKNDNKTIKNDPKSQPNILRQLVEFAILIVTFKTKRKTRIKSYDNT